MRIKLVSPPLSAKIAEIELHPEDQTDENMIAALRQTGFCVQEMGSSGPSPVQCLVLKEGYHRTVATLLPLLQHLLGEARQLLGELRARLAETEGGERGSHAGSEPAAAAGEAPAVPDCDACKIPMVPDTAAEGTVFKCPSCGRTALETTPR